MPDRAPEHCLFHVIPAPVEETVSYGGGTSRGPQAILDASVQLEAFDGISCPCEHGIHTTPPVRTFDAIEQAVSQVLAHQRIPVILGGEHAVTNGVLRALKKLDRPVGIVQFDAHADLRDTYEGNPHSHACVMRRALDSGFDIFQIGVRALSLDEHQLRRRLNIGHLDAEVIARRGIPDDLLPADFPSHIFITFDVDALCPSLMPATGTPEPGGLTWWQTMTCLQHLADIRTIIGFDVVELAPIANLHASDFTAARLTYNVMGMIARSG
ncbi:MAG: agmatinase [Lentisphaeria bacterium]|nr:agmatinase [Lentisphaeria bacterium]